MWCALWLFAVEHWGDIAVERVDLNRGRMVVRMDPNRLPATAWRDREHFDVVVNAGMFHDDGAPVGLLVDRGVSHGSDNPKYGGFIAWDPVSSSDAAIVATGRDCAGFDLAALRNKYRSIIQGMRFLDCDGKAIDWKDPKLYSAVGLGVDAWGRAVFVHARPGHLMKDLATELAKHALTGAIFLEGGPEASLVTRSRRLVGSYETGFNENDDNTDFWPLPNVLGVHFAR